MPLLLNVPTFSICGPVLLELGTEEQKKEHLTKVLRGDEVLVQFLSEHRAAAPTWPASTTRAVRDGDVFIVNGAKIWSSRPTRRTTPPAWCGPTGKRLSTAASPCC